MSTIAVVAAALMASAAPSPEPQCSFLRIEDRLVSVGYSARSYRMIDTVVLHSIHDPTRPDPYHIDSVLALMERHRVSAHYVIDRSGIVYRLVDERHISFHAGKSQMPDPDKRVSVNRFSVGIEIINGYADRPTENQYCALITLLGEIKRRHPIRRIVAHGEVAGERRTDPWNFDWSRIKE
jgi:N-acetyl-anhydromuramyl-L-alanine amidase AmpD